MFKGLNLLTYSAYQYATIHDINPDCLGAQNSLLTI